jgi:predicted nucleic acid-binding protein
VTYVFDTNVVARLLDNDARVEARFAAVAMDNVGMPLVVLAELRFGVEKSSRRPQNRARLQRFAAGVRELPFAAALAARYAVVRAETRDHKTWTQHQTTSARPSESLLGERDVGDLSRSGRSYDERLARNAEAPAQAALVLGERVAAHRVRAGVV